MSVFGERQRRSWHFKACPSGMDLQTFCRSNAFACFIVIVVVVVAVVLRSLSSQHAGSWYRSSQAFTVLSCTRLLSFIYSVPCFVDRSLGLPAPSRPPHPRSLPLSSPALVQPNSRPALFPQPSCLRTPHAPIAIPFLSRASC